MNGSLVMAGVIVATSIVLFSVVAYRLSSLSNDVALRNVILSMKDSTLEENIKDILEFLPLNDVRSIVDNYLRHDPQIDDTVSFVEDQKKFIGREFQRMPQLTRLLSSLKASGLQVDDWKGRIQGLWRTKVAFVKTNPSIAMGGLTGMVQSILHAVPKNELHKLLRQKVKYSDSFRKFLQLLKSKDFMDFCGAINNNIVLQQHTFWAKQEGIEITFALELLTNLYIYLTEEIW